VINLCVFVEGDSEEAFVEHVLGPHLNARDVFTEATKVVTWFDRKTGSWHKGGGSRWAKWRNDLVKFLANDRRSQRRVTTMFDLYRLPKDAPGVEVHRVIADTARRIDLLEAAMSADIKDSRFLPYLQRHEFEALVLAGLDHLDDLLIDAPALRGLKTLRAEIAGIPPEDINDGVETAPSRRLSKQIDGYDKITHGVEAVKRVGLSALRAACPRFDAWVTRLEALA
jgi:hypothetical protein